MKKRISVMLTTCAFVSTMFVFSAGTYADTTEVSLTDEVFPDENLLSVAKSYDSDGNDSLSTEEISSITELEFKGDTTINDLKGLENFTELKKLSISDSALTEVDLSLNTNLAEVSLIKNSELTSIKLDEGVTLFTVVASPKVEKLDLKDYKDLELLYCSTMSPEIDFGEKSPIKRMALANNDYKELDLSIFPELISLGLNKTEVTSIDLSAAPKLVAAEIDFNPIESITLNDNLTSFGFIGSKLTRIDISRCSTLVDIVSESPVNEISDSPVFEPYTGEEIGRANCKYWGDLKGPVFMTDIEDVVTVSGTEGFVARMYKFVLDREGDTDGVKYWTEQLSSLSKTGGEVALDFFESPEFKAKELEDEDYLKLLYKVFFNREPDDDGLAFWKEKLANKEYDRLSVAKGFIYSREWNDLCKDFGIKSGGEITPDPDPVVENKPQFVVTDKEPVNAFVERLYNTAMNRVSDPEGKAYWSEKLSKKELTAEEVAAYFFSCPEMKNYKLSDEAYITRIYHTFLNREPDAKGKTYWTEYLKTHSRSELTLGFTRSEEFVNKCIECGIIAF